MIQVNTEKPYMTAYKAVVWGFLRSDTHRKEIQK